MEPPAYQAPAPFPTPVTNTTTRDSRRLLIIGGIVVLVLLVGYLLYRFWGGDLLGNDALEGDVHIVLASDGIPLRSAQTLNVATGETALLVVPGQGTAVTVDAHENETTGLYLIADPAFTRANLYRLDRTKPEAGLAQLTASDTVKYALSYDELSGVAAYATQTAGAPARIVAWSPVTKTEKELGNGERPVVLRGGFFVAFEREGKLIAVNVESGEVREILNLGQGAAYAIDQENLRAALYNPVTASVDHFSLASLTSASYESSVPVASPPAALAYAGEKLVALRASEGTLVFSSLDGEEETAVPATVSFDEYSLSIHDSH